MTQLSRLRSVVREHRPDPLDSSRCAGCGFVYTEARIECPSAQARGTSEMSPSMSLPLHPPAGKVRTPGAAQLGGFGPTQELREHQPDGAGIRCVGCRFRYTADQPECPTVVAAYAALFDGPGGGVPDQPRRPVVPSAPVVHVARAASETRLACQRDPDAWDLDQPASLQTWERALQECRVCPLLEQCRTQRDRLYPRAGERDHGPSGLIWSGEAFGNRGQRLDWYQLRDLSRRPQAHAEQVAA